LKSNHVKWLIINPNEVKNLNNFSFSIAVKVGLDLTLSPLAHNLYRILATKVSPKLCPIKSRNHAQQGIHERFSRVFVVCTANGIKIICQGGLGNDMSQIRERETVVTSDFMPTFGDILKPCSIDPSDGGCHHGKVDVIHDGMGITGLAFAAPDVLFDLLETGSP